MEATYEQRIDRQAFDLIQEHGDDARIVAVTNANDALASIRRSKKYDAAYVSGLTNSIMFWDAVASRIAEVTKEKTPDT